MNNVPVALRQLLIDNPDVYLQLKTNSRKRQDRWMYTIGASVDVPQEMMAMLALVDENIDCQLAVNVYKLLIDKHFVVTLCGDNTDFTYAMYDWTPAMQLNLIKTNSWYGDAASLVCSMVMPLAVRLAGVVETACTVLDEDVDLVQVSDWLTAVNHGEIKVY